MRVLMVSKALVTGVYQKKLEELARQPGIELLAVVPPNWKERRVGTLPLERRFTSGYELVVEPMRLNGNHHLHWYPGLAKRVRQFRPDVVHIDEEPFNLVAAQATRLAQRAGAQTLFFTWQNIDKRYPLPFRWFERHALAYASAGIAGNRAAFEILRRRGFNKRLEIIPQFGVDPAIYHPMCSSQRNSEPIVAYYGRVVPEKGIDTLIQAIALLPEPVRAIVVGAGDYQTELERLAGELDVRQRIEFRAPIPAERIPEFLATVSAVIVPSRTRANWKEQFGRVIVESMSCGVPVIGSDSGEIPNVIGEAGIIFPEGDSAALAQAIDRVIDGPQLAETLSRAGRTRVLEHYTQEQVALATWNIYREIVPQAEL